MDFPHLEILELIGHGGMGAVYKARQRKLDRLVALKIIRPEAAADPEFAERFNREARTLARLSHPHIVGIHDFGEVPPTPGRPGGLYYFVMEYVEGANLRALLEAGDLQPAVALAVIPQICEALQYAHDEGVIHRDIKPENILLDQRGRAKIADFGLAKLAGTAQSDFTLTGTHQVMGTPRYMAPEQMEGSRTVDHRADIFSLGVVFYELLTGEVPAGHFEPPSQRAPIDSRLDSVVLRALAREPSRRFQRADEVRREVEAISSSAGVATGPRENVSAQDGVHPASPAGASTLFNREILGVFRWATRGAATHQDDVPAFPAFVLLLLCLLGCLTILLPWFRFSIPEGTTLGDELETASAIVHSVYGWELSAGVVTSMLFALTALLLLMTPANRPVSAARALWFVLLALGLLGGIGVALYEAPSVAIPVHSTRLDANAHSSHVKPPARHEKVVIVPQFANHLVTYHAGFLGAGGLACCLLVLSGIGVRHAVAQPTEAPSPAPRESAGTVVAKHRFVVARSADLWQQAVFHFEGLGYELLEQRPDKIVFRRGSYWAGLWESDIQKMQTHVAVRTSPGQAGTKWVSCDWQVAAWGSWITKRDIARLESEGRDFETHLAQLGHSGPPPEPQPAVVEKPPDLTAIRGEVDGPSLAMIAGGGLLAVGNVALFGLLLGLTMAPDFYPLIVMSVPGVVVGILMLAGGFRLRSLVSLGFVQFAAIVAVLPVTLTWVLTAPIGIWTLIVLARPYIRETMVRRTFQGEQPGQFATAPEVPTARTAEKPPDLPAALAEVDGPSLAMMIGGVLLAAVSGGILIFMLGNKSEDDLAVIMVPSVLTGIVMLIGGIRLRVLRSPGLIQIAAITAVLPLNVGWLLTAPIGFWTLAVLARPQVRETMVRRTYRSE